LKAVETKKLNESGEQVNASPHRGKRLVEEKEFIFPF
jgi:hypothetical protein